ncbi:hypothetical protein LCGC14_1359400 [marine sediment metagenome]|uniref:Beta-lactamase-related domain-containing protein n=1 Tax=marine sediment metagenome TaxID=412755 RepID=A0A0F9NAU1_9ZZZZ
MKGFGAFVGRMMDRWGVPGLAVAVVQGGRTVLAEGFGLCDRKSKRQVTPRTLFPIASATKAFTATALGILLDDGKIQWDLPVRDYLPGFRLADPVATERATVRDLLCHRTGLPRHDNAWYGLTLSRAELFDRLRHLPPSADFRARWQYQNMMFMVAGLVVAAVAGRTWEQFVRERILDPLGMTGTNFGAAEALAQADHALPYKRSGRRVARTHFDDVSSLGPAGGINSNAIDMARWLTMNLSGGRIGRRRIISAKALAAIHTPQIPVPEPPQWPELLHGAYAMGWQVQPYRGHPTIWHGGLVNGFQTRVTLLPRLKAGVAVMTNMMGHPVQLLLAYRACDRLLGLRPLPWTRRLAAEEARQAKAKTSAKRRAARAA